MKKEFTALEVNKMMANSQLELLKFINKDLSGTIEDFRKMYEFGRPFNVKEVSHNVNKLAKLNNFLRDRRHKLKGILDEEVLT